MRLGSKWTPVPRFPVTTTIYEHVLRGSQRTQPARADIVSGELCGMDLIALLQTSAPDPAQKD